MQSYLSQYYQYVKLDSGIGLDGSLAMHQKWLVKRGVLLGSFLFILYSADIHIKHCKYHFYAVDTQMYISCEPNDIDSATRNLNEDLTCIANWPKSNALFLLNPTKSKYLYL